MTGLVSPGTRKWWILAAMTGSNALIFLDQSVLPVALPTIQRELLFSELIVQWTINIYLLVLTTFALAGGRIGDILGHRKIFTLGLLLFGLASAFCALSQNSGMFLASRALQGLGGALLIPTAPAILSKAFPSDQQGKVFGLFLSVGAFFLSVGPVVGGFITQYMSWRYVFWINLPIAAIGFLLTFISVPRSAKKIETFDSFGFLSLVLGVGGIITALMQGKYWGWTSWPILIMGFGGLFLLALLAPIERKAQDPFIDFSLFRRSSYTTANLCLFCIQFILMLTVFWAIYFQKILGYSPLVAGIWSMVASSPIMFVGALSGHLFDRYGGKLPIVLGFCLVAFAILWFVIVPVPDSPWLLLPVVLPFGCGVPLIIIPSFTLFLKGLPHHKKGVAIGMSTTLRQLGSTAGMAVFGAFYLHQMDKSGSQVSASTSINVLGFCITLFALVLAWTLLQKNNKAAE